MTVPLFTCFQTRQRALARSALLPPEFGKALYALTAEFRQQCLALDALRRESLCLDLETHLRGEFSHAASPRHREVLLALLRKIERLKFQSPAR